MENHERYEPIKVLDHGFVHLLDWMGDDKTIVQAARCSIAGEGVRATSEDRGLIRYLMRHSHTTPFETVVFRFRVKLPIFVERQWVRHRMSTTNEMSARYGELPEEFYVPAVEDVQYQAKTNKQGRAEPVGAVLANFVRYDMEALGHMGFYSYHRFLGKMPENLGAQLAEGGGIARELARVVLPLSTYTMKEWSVDLHNLFHFLRLRLHSHAQKEIRVYAEAIASLVKEICPLAYEAFEDFRLNSMTLSAQEVQAVRQMIMVADTSRIDIDLFKTRREMEEFVAKGKLFLGELE